MRRLLGINLLIFAVLASATALAYYGYIYTAEAASRERAFITDTMRELAWEKIIGIESPMLEVEDKLFAAIDPDSLPDLASIVRTQRAPVASVFVLGEDLRVLPSGYVTTRVVTERGDEGIEFLTKFEEEIVKTLPLATLPEGKRGHVHQVIDGRPYLFSFRRGRAGGRAYTIVIEADLNHLVGTVFQHFFGQASPRLYQVVDERGLLVYGVPFRGASTVVELPFTQTVSGWKLRVAQRDAPTQAARGRRKVIDIVLIGLALVVITAGLALLLLAMWRERKANDLKSEFISNVSHELKTPLSIISMFGEMLASGRVRGPEQATEYADVIWRESVRLARLIDNVLDFAKIERGVDVYEFAEGDVAEVVARAVELSTHRLHNAHLTVGLDLPPEPALARIDQNALTLAVLNLIDNAIKYAADGQRLEVSVKPDGKHLAIAVRDFGPGVEAEERQRIFERFYRARAVRLRPIRGSGIGLALVEHIATAHGGKVAVADAAPGAIFTISIPRAG